MHPGRDCEHAVVRFTAPVAGTYRISGQFYGLDDNGTETNTDVEVSVNAASVFVGSVNLVSGPRSASFSPINATLAVNNTVDFQVGCSQNYNYDSTALNAVIELKKQKKMR
jgi:hypothetical protein